MWYPATVTSAAAAEPVTVAEAKTQCRVLHSDEDGLFGDLIETARNHVEKYCGIRFAAQTIEVKCDDWSDFFYLPEGPVQSVSGITYVDTDGATQTLSTDVYEVRAEGVEARIVLKYNQTWPSIQSGSRITVTAVVGYVEIPAAVKYAMLAWITDAYDNRGASIEENTVLFDTLLANHRRFT